MTHRLRFSAIAIVTISAVTMATTSVQGSVLWTVGIDMGNPNNAASPAPWNNWKITGLGSGTVRTFDEAVEGDYWGALGGSPFTGNIIDLDDPFTMRWLASSAGGSTGGTSPPAGYPPTPGGAFGMDTPSDLDQTPADGAWFKSASGGVAWVDMKLEDLDSSLQYNLWFYIGHAASELNTTVTVTDAGDPSSQTAIALNNTEWLKFDGLTADENGEINFRWETAAGSTTILNAMVIQAVPEPGSLALLGLGGMLMLARRRRQA